jgi:hypothetical protein
MRKNSSDSDTVVHRRDLANSSTMAYDSWLRLISCRDATSSAWWMSTSALLALAAASSTLCVVGQRCWGWATHTLARAGLPTVTRWRGDSGR